MVCRKFILGYIAMLCCSSFAHHAYSQATSYQDIALTTFSKQRAVSLKKLSGKPTYLKFWATWCQPCMKQMPHFEHAQQTYGEEINIIAVNININEQKDRIKDTIKRFNLTMPVWLDNEGALGVALGLIGTPYSVLISSEGKILYATHNADDELDKRLAMLANKKTPDIQAISLPDVKTKEALLMPWQKGEHLIFFTATWCDWYLEESRPKMAKKCKVEQKQLSRLYKKFPNLPWKGVVNHLWTDEQAIKDFEKLYKLPFHFEIDSHGILFNHFNVREIPTIMLIKEGNVLERMTSVAQAENVLKKRKMASK